jgi:hypothetical protein
MLGLVLIVYFLILAIGLLESGLHYILLLLCRQAQVNLDYAPALGRDQIHVRVVPKPQCALILPWKHGVLETCGSIVWN